MYGVEEVAANSATAMALQQREGSRNTEENAKKQKENEKNLGLGTEE